VFIIKNKPVIWGMVRQGRTAAGRSYIPRALLPAALPDFVKAGRKALAGSVGGLRVDAPGMRLDAAIGEDAGGRAGAVSSMFVVDFSGGRTAFPMIPFRCAHNECCSPR